MAAQQHDESKGLNEALRALRIDDNVTPPPAKKQDKQKQILHVPPVHHTLQCNEGQTFAQYFAGDANAAGRVMWLKDGRYALYLYPNQVPLEIDSRAAEIKDVSISIDPLQLKDDEHPQMPYWKPNNPYLAKQLRDNEAKHYCSAGVLPLQFAPDGTPFALFATWEDASDARPQLYFVGGRRERKRVENAKRERLGRPFMKNGKQKKFGIACTYTEQDARATAWRELQEETGWLTGRKDNEHARFYWIRLDDDSLGELGRTSGNATLQLHVLSTLAAERTAWTCSLMDFRPYGDAQVLFASNSVVTLLQQLSQQALQQAAAVAAQAAVPAAAAMAKPEEPSTGKDN